MNIKNIISAFESDTHKFGWSYLAHVVPINIVGEIESIIKNYTSAAIVQVKKQARAA